MTKVALCISGQPRSAIETFPFIYENIIIPNNADEINTTNIPNNINYISTIRCKCINVFSQINNSYN